MKTFKEIQDLVFELAHKINQPLKYFILLSQSSGDGRYYLEIKDGYYHYISVDRSEELDHFKTSNLDDLLYKILSNIISTIALQYEVKNRVCGQDTRRIMFDKQIELLSIISKSWGERIKHEINEILSRAPYEDD